MSSARIQGIKQAQADIKALRLILKQMDPASGVAIAFRCGVAFDNDSVENDHERRPWTTVEVADMELATGAINAAIASSEASLRMRLRWAREEYEELGEFLASPEGEKK